MDYITLTQIKKQLNIEDDYTDDDVYLTDLISVATDAIQRTINAKIDDIAANNAGEIPSALLHAILLLASNYYQNREIVANIKVTELPYNFRYLTGLFQNYEN